MHSVYKGVAHPWQCDVLGHLTTRFYVAMFDDAAYHYLHTIFGWTANVDPDGRLSWADVRHTLDYKAEVMPGDLLEIRADVVKIGGKSLTAAYEMNRLGDNEIVATLESVMVLFDRHARQSVSLSDELRQQANKFLLQPTS